MTARVLAFPSAPRDRGRLLTPQEAAADALGLANARIKELERQVDLLEREKHAAYLKHADERIELGMRLQQARGGRRWRLQAMAYQRIAAEQSKALPVAVPDRPRVLAGIPHTDEWIYAMVDLRTVDHVYYIGRSREPQSRYKGHLSNPANAVMAEWIHGLLCEGLQPLMLFVEQCDMNDAHARETAWVAEYKARGMAEGNVFAPQRRGRDR